MWRPELAKQDTSPTPDTEEALNAFANGATIQARQAALTALMRTKVIPKKADDARFQQGLDALILAATDPGAVGESRLLAMAEVVRAAQVVKRLQPRLAEWLGPGLRSDLPGLKVLDDADDRLNAARALSLGSGEWLPDYLADAIACEEQGENARLTLVQALLARCDRLDELLGSLARAMASQRPETESPGDSLARRLTRTLVALRGAIPTSELEAGSEIGQALHQLVSLPFRALGRPREEKVLHELTREVVLLTHEIVRSRFSVATDPAVFQAVAYCRQILGGGTWPDVIQDALALLIKDVREALVLLGRQGVRDQGLLEQLDMLCNYPQRARVIAKDIAERHQELDEETRHWLIHGRVQLKREASAAAQETVLRDVDASIGLALNAALEVRQSLFGLREPLLSVLDIYEQGLVSVTQDALRRIDTLLLQLEQVGDQRALALFGNVGEEVDFTPKYFQAVGDGARQRMIVRQPAVVRVRKDGTVGDAVLKGLVE